MRLVTVQDNMELVTAWTEDSGGLVTARDSAALVTVRGSAGLVTVRDS